MWYGPGTDERVPDLPRHRRRGVPRHQPGSLPARAGHEVVSLDLADFDYPEQDRVDVVVGDIRDATTSTRAMRGRRHRRPLRRRPAALHAGGHLRDRHRRHAHACSRRAERTASSGSCTISSTAVYGIPDHHPLYEDDKLDGVGPYGEAKIEAEEVCLEYRGKGMCVPIIRPKSFVGPERLGVFALLYDWAQRRATASR